MLALLIALAFSAPDPSILTIHKYHDPKEEWLTELARCESGLRTDIRVLDTNNKYSYGLMQYQMGTWLHYGKSFGATAENIYDGELQRRVTRAVLDAKGWQQDWVTCGSKTETKLGPY